MSSISKDINQSGIDYLALDFGFYPTSKNIRDQLLARPFARQKEKTIIMDINSKTMSSAEWDAVIDNILKAKRCITL